MSHFGVNVSMIRAGHREGHEAAQENFPVESGVCLA